MHSGPSARSPVGDENKPAEPFGTKTEPASYQRIQAVDRAMVLLKTVAGSETAPTVLELARRCDINRTTAWRLLRTLEHHGLVDRDAVTHRYTVGYAAAGIAAAAADDALVRRARPVLQDLADRTGEAVNLAVIKRSAVVPVEQVDPANVTMPSWLSKPLPLHATSGGKAFLAWLAPDEQEAVLPKELARYTDRTVTDRDQLRRDLQNARSSGYAVCAREYENFTSGVSAPVLSATQLPLAVITVWGPAPRNSINRLHALGKEAARAAEYLRDLLA